MVSAPLEPSAYNAEWPVAAGKALLSQIIGQWLWGQNGHLCKEFLLHPPLPWANFDFSLRKPRISGLPARMIKLRVVHVVTA